MARKWLVKEEARADVSEGRRGEETAEGIIGEEMASEGRGEERC